jgi:chromosome partitioning protein
MRTIAITINRGGVGKTTLAKHLATAAVAAGLTAMILDMDSQENSASWGARRKDYNPLPVAKFVTEKQLPQELAKARAAECDIVFIDTPPARGSEAVAAVEAAELVLIPFWADTDAYAGLEKTAALARKLGVPAIGVLNYVTPNSRSQVEIAQAVLNGFEMPVPMAPAVLHRYEPLYRGATTAGLAVQEMEPDSRAAADIAALWAWLSAELQLGTSADVHKGAA